MRTRNRASNIWWAAFPLLALLIAIVAFFWKLTLTRQFTWMDGPDTANQILPWFHFQAVQWHRWTLPLWDPRHWGGQSLIGQHQPGVMYPLNWLLFLSPLKHGRLQLSILNYYFVLIHFIGACSGYFLCRGLNCSRVAAFAGGLAFSVSGYLGVNNWPQMINGAVWCPLVLLYWIRAMDGARPMVNAATAGALLGLSILGGHHQVPLFTGLAVVGIAVLYVLNGYHLTPTILFRCVGAIAMLVGFAFLASAVQTLPAQEYWADALRWVGAKSPVAWKDRVPYSVHSTFSLNPVGIIGIVIPYIAPPFGFPPYIGVTLISLAVLGAVSRWGNIHVRAMVCVGIGSLVYALGGMSLFEGILYATVPLVDKARNPSMAIFGFHVAACVLAAFGLDALRAPDRRLRRIARAASLVLVSFGALAYLGLAWVHVTKGNDVYAHGGEAFAAFAAVLASAVIAGRLRNGLSHHGAAALLTLLIVFENGAVTGADYPHREAGWTNYDKLFGFDDLASYVKRQPGLFRVNVDSGSIPYNFGDWHDLDQINGYAGVTANVILHYGSGSAKLMMGERYSLGATADRAEQKLVFTGTSGVKIFENPDAFPRAWTVHEAIQVRPEAIDEWFGRPMDVLRKQAIMAVRPPELASCAGLDSVQVLSTTANRSVLDAELACAGLIVVSDTYARGWIATVDGKAARIYETNGFMRGVVVGAGRHRIEFRYKPATVRAGGVLSIAGVLLLLGLRLRSSRALRASDGARIAPL